MRYREHLEILKQGTDRWNRWRTDHPEATPYLIGVDLRESDLRGVNLNRGSLLGANLSGSNLAGANLNLAQLSTANLASADLSQANLIGATITQGQLTGVRMSLTNLAKADLSRANLSRATLRGAQLLETKLVGASLRETNFSSALLGGTIFGDSDLSEAEGLNLAYHYGPSTVGIDTIYRSKGCIPEGFLRGAGVPEDFIVYMKSLVGKAIEFYSCFISHSARDQDFASRLYEGLKAKNVRCWYFSEDAKWGEPVWGEIDRSIKVCDKLVVICSENSLQSEPVIREIERALQREDHEHKNILFPVRIDNYLFEAWQHPRKADVESKVVGDFRNWKDHDTYTKAFNRLLEALNRPEK